MTDQIDRLEAGATETETHVMCYLASMLYSFAGGRQGAVWGYDFAATGAGAPFSQDLSNSITQLRASGHLRFDADTYSLSETGAATRQTLVQHERFQARIEYLESAANTALAMTLPMATGAVMLEPQLVSATTIAHRRPLLDQAGLAILDPYFAGLRSQVSADRAPADADLFSVAVLWLNYLRASSEKNLEHAV